MSSFPLVLRVFLVNVRQYTSLLLGPGCFLLQPSQSCMLNLMYVTLQWRYLVTHKHTYRICTSLPTCFSLVESVQSKLVLGPYNLFFLSQGNPESKMLDSRPSEVLKCSFMNVGHHLLFKIFIFIAIYFHCYPLVCQCVEPKLPLICQVSHLQV